MSDRKSLQAEAEARYERGDLEGALSACRRLLAGRPDDPEILSGMGAICFGLRRFGDSRHYLARALKLDPGCSEARDNLNMLCRALGVSPDAVLAQEGDGAFPEPAPGAIDISVVVPVRDQLQPLETCLDALYAQSFPSEGYEVLLVANGVSGEDGEELRKVTAPWERQFGDRLKRLRIDTASIPLARNEGIAHARGRIIVQINSDTVLSRTALEEHYAEHEGFGFDPRCVVVGGRRFPDPYLKSLFNYLHEAVPLYTALHRARPRFPGDHTWFVTCNLSSLREAYRRFGMYDASFAWGSDEQLGRRWEKGHGVRIYVDANIISYHLHWLSFDQWRRKCIVAAPYWFRRNMGMSIEEMPPEGRAAARKELDSMTVDARAVEQEVRRLETAFSGPERFRGETVMGAPAFTLDEFIFRLRPLLKQYRQYLQYREICRRLDAAEDSRGCALERERA